METRNLPPESVILVIEKLLAQLGELALLIRELGDEKAQQFWLKQCCGVSHLQLPDHFQALGNLLITIEQTMENATRSQVERLITELQVSYSHVLFDDKVRSKVQKMREALMGHLNQFPVEYLDDPVEVAYTQVMEMMDELTKKAAQLGLRERELAVHEGMLAQRQREVQQMHQEAQRLLQTARQQSFSAENRDATVPMQTNSKSGKGFLSQWLSGFGMYTEANMPVAAPHHGRQAKAPRAPEKPMRIV